MKPSLHFRWLAISAAALVMSSSGCQNTAKTAAQPARANLEGKAVPAATLQRGSTLENLTAGELGIGGGFLIAAAPDKIRGREQKQAVAASEAAEASPARLQQVHQTPDADLNHDGFITLDEVLAMVRAGLREDEVIDRLRKTGYSFQMTPQQERFLTDRQVPQKVVSALHDLAAGSVIVSAPTGH